MPDLDGSIKLGVELTPESVSKTAEKLRKKVESIFESGASKQLDAQFKATEKTMSDLYTKSVELSKQLENLGKTQIPTDDYKELQALLEQDERAANTLMERMTKFVDLGGSETSKGFIRMQYDLEQLRDSITNAKDEMAAMRAEGTAFVSGDASSKYTAMVSQLNDVNNKMVIATTRAQNQTATAEEKARQEAIKRAEQENKTADAVEKALARQTAALEKQVLAEEKAAQAARERAEEQRVIDAYNRSDGSEIRPMLLQSYLSDIGERLSDAIAGSSERSKTALANLGKRFLALRTTAVKALDAIKKRLQGVQKSAGSTTASLGASLKRLLLMGIGVRSIFALVRKLRSAVMDGLKSLAQFNGGANSVNASISQLQSSLNYLKNSWATAFAPIIEFVTPALVRLMDLISQVATKIGMLFAALGGKATFVRAKKAQTDFAASLDKTKDSADKANGSLADFDKLTVITTNDSKAASSGSDGGGVGDMFEEVPIDSKISDMADKLKSVIDDIFQVFKDAWANKGQEVIDAWTYAFEQLKQLAIDIGKSLLEVWTNGSGQRFVENILILVAEIGWWIGDIARALDEAWVSAGRGTALIQSIFDAWNAVLELIITISQTAREVWNESFGVQFFADILEIITNLNLVVANLATRFKEAWESNGTGKAILQDIANIILDMTGTVNSVTESFKNWAAGISFEPLLDSVQRVTHALEPLAGDLGAGVQWFFNNVILPLATWTIQDALPTFLNLVATALDTLHTIIETLQPLAQWFWDEFLQPLAEWTGGLIIDTFNLLNDALKKFGDWVSKHQTIVEAFVIILGTLATVVGAVVAIFTVMSTVMTVVSTVIGIVQTAAALLAPVIGAISAPVLIVIGVITALIAIGVALYQNWDTIREKAISIWSAVTSFISDKISSLRQWINDFITGIAERWDNWLTSIYESASNIWESIHEFISDIIEGISDRISTGVDNIRSFWLDTFNDIQNTTSSIFHGIYDVVSSVVNSILGVIESMSNGIVNGVNGAINALNNLSFSVPDWIPGIGGNSIGFNIPTLNGVHIPRLAQGAVIPPNREFMAVLGDQSHGTNIEAPVDTIIDAVNVANEDLVAYMSELVTLTRQLLAKDATITPKSLFDAVRAENENYILKTGRSGFAY